MFCIRGDGTPQLHMELFDLGVLQLSKVERNLALDHLSDDMNCGWDGEGNEFTLSTGGHSARTGRRSKGDGSSGVLAEPLSLSYIRSRSDIHDLHVFGAAEYVRYPGCARCVTLF